MELLQGNYYKMHRFLFLLYFIALVAVPTLVKAQVVRGSADFVGVTEYVINGEPDSLFVFFQLNTDRFIEANTPDGDSARFEWYRYNNSTNTYVFETSENDTISRKDLIDDADFLEPFGYQLVVVGATYTDTSRCWLVLNNLGVAIINADTADVEGKPQKVIKEFQKRCSLISDINARIDSAEMHYFNLLTGQNIEIKSNYSISNNSWSSSPSPEEGGNIFSPNDLTWLSVTVNEPSWEDSYLLITVEDALGYVVADSVWHESIIPKARFSLSHIPLDDVTYYPDQTDRYYVIYGQGSPIGYAGKSAPAKFLFKNESENANLYTWHFDDGVSETVSEDSAVHTYNLPGNYYAYLLAENFLITGDVCVDTSPDFQERADHPDIPIEVDKPPGFPTTDELANVFTPPNPPNNYWRFHHDASITDFEIAIYNRYGNRVHHFEGNIRDWEGWDGRINKSDRMASSGVYYYVIKDITPLPLYHNPLDEAPPEAVDIYEDESQNNNLKRGFIHLYNNE